LRHSFPQVENYGAELNCFGPRAKHEQNSFHVGSEYRAYGEAHGTRLAPPIYPIEKCSGLPPPPQVHVLHRKFKGVRVCLGVKTAMFVCA
jgi:hypothetical protein